MKYYKIFCIRDILNLLLPVNSFSLMTIKTQRRGQISGTSANFILLSFSGDKGLIYPGSAQKGYQGRTELLP